MPTEHRIMSLGDSLQELAALGSPVDVAVGDMDAACDPLEIAQCREIGENALMELESGGIGYMLSVRITNQTSRPMYIEDVHLQVPWEEPFFDWLLPQTLKTRTDRRGKGSTFQIYRFPGKMGLSYQFRRW